MKYPCACVGRTCIDYIVTVDEYPKRNTKVALDKFKVCLGGQAANASVVLSCLGVKTILATMLSCDEYGTIAKSILRKYKNIKLVNLNQQKNFYTPLAFIWSDRKTGGRTIVYQKILSNTIISKKRLIEVVRKTNNILFDHQSSKFIFDVIHEIRKNNVKLMMDAERYDPYLMKLVENINYLVFSKEIVKSFRSDVKELLKKFVKLGPEIVCCTLGKDGAVAMVKGSKKVYYSKAIKVKPIDTTGAGDVFHAGFMYGIINQWRIETILAFANKLAGLSTKYIGGSSFVETKDFANLVYHIAKV